MTAVYSLQSTVYVQSVVDGQGGGGGDSAHVADCGHFRNLTDDMYRNQVTERGDTRGHVVHPPGCVRSV